MNLTEKQFAALKWLIKVGTVDVENLIGWDQRPLIGLWKKGLIQVVGRRTLYLAVTKRGGEFWYGEVKKRKGRERNGVLRVSDERSRNARSKARSGGSLRHVSQIVAMGRTRMVHGGTK